MRKRMEFLKSTGGNSWKTLEELVADLDRAGYWKGEPERSLVEKRGHARKMLATLVFREAASQEDPRSSDPPPVGRHVFVSTLKASDSGELVRAYKQVFNLTSEELQEILEDEEANRAYHTKRAARNKALAEGSLEEDKEVDAAALLLDELAEKTMRRAWPEASPAERRRIVLAASLQNRHSEQALREISERCRAEGFDVEKLLDEYLHAAEVPPVVDPQEASEIAKPAAEYFKVVDELGGLNFGKLCAEALLAARTNTVNELAKREGIGYREAAALFDGELNEYAEEFQGVLEAYRRDTFGWTLDEHLQFAIECRGE